MNGTRGVKCPHCGKRLSILHGSSVICVCGEKFDIEANLALKMNNLLIPKNPPHRDRSFLDWLRDQPCFISGMRTHEYETVVPAHTGNTGRGMKAPDKHTLPMAQSLHLRSHNEGVVTFWTSVFTENPRILDDLLSSYAENVYYKEYLDEK